MKRQATLTLALAGLLPAGARPLAARAAASETAMPLRSSPIEALRFPGKLPARIEFAKG